MTIIDVANAHESGNMPGQRACGHRIPKRVLAIIMDVCASYDVDLKDVLAPATVPGVKRREISDARQAAMRAVRSITWAEGKPPSFPVIGRWFGRDHTCVMLAVKKAAK